MKEMRKGEEETETDGIEARMLRKDMYQSLVQRAEDFKMKRALDNIHMCRI